MGQVEKAKQLFANLTKKAAHNFCVYLNKHRTRIVNYHYYQSNKICSIGSGAVIKYPTDVDLLNQARKTTELIIDILYKSLKENLDQKPRTYRKKARKDYLKFAKNRKPSGKERRNAVKKQLQYIKRNLGHIEQLMEKETSLELLSRRQYRNLLVSSEIYRQLPQWM